MTRIPKAKRERMNGYNDILKHHNITLSEEHLLNLDYAILNRPEGVEGNDIIDEIIEKHNTRPRKRERKRIHRCNKHSGRIVKSYKSLSLAAQDLGDIKYKSNISAVASGRLKSFKSWVFKWAD